MGPFTPAVVTEDNEIHNICHLLTLFGETDLLLICGLPTHVQLRSWNQAYRSQGFSGAAAVSGTNPTSPLLEAWDTLTVMIINTAVSCAVYFSLMILKSNCYTNVMLKCPYQKMFNLIVSMEKILYFFKNSPFQ